MNTPGLAPWTSPPQGAGTAFAVPAAPSTLFSAPPPVQQLVAALGLYTQIRLDGTVAYNEPLVQQVVAHGSAALNALRPFLAGVTHIPALLEGLYAAEKLQLNGIPTADMLYPALVRWNSHPDPAVQQGLARFYRVSNHPKGFGPMLATLVNYALNQYPMQASPAFNVTEAVGQTVLEQIASRAADLTAQRLLPYLNHAPARPSADSTTPRMRAQLA